jgi:hypothetical protein
VLRRPQALERLLGVVRDCDRLVLLGDTLELRHGPLREVLDVAEPVLRELGQALGPGSEVLILPGNHDHRLLRRWSERRSAAPSPPPLGLEAAVDWRDGEPLALLASALAPADVRATYPGVWLRDDVYAMHGHYADRHNTVPIMERVGAAMMTRAVSEPDGGPRCAEDYEAILAPMYAWIDTVAEGGGVRGQGGGRLQVKVWRMLQAPGGGRTLRSAGLSAGFSLLVAALNRAGAGPFGTDVSGPELRRAGLRAFEEVLSRLGVGSAHVLFGHTHRAGPLPADDPSEWRTAAGSAIVNAGSWVRVGSFVSDGPGESPYRPGFCVLLEDDGAPRLVNLLDGAKVPIRA